MSEEKVLRQAQKLLAEERELVLTDIQITYEILQAARRRYEMAVLKADRLGIGPTVIANRIGLGEAGVRLFIKRHKEKK